MRVMVIVKANRDSEAGVMPSEQILAQMRVFNEQLGRAGVLVSIGGLTPSSNGKRIKVTGGRQMVTDGPFTESKEVIGGFAIWEVGSVEEALEWLSRFPDTGRDEELEIRPMFPEGQCGSASAALKLTA